MSLKIQASSHFVAESHIESADAILDRKFTDHMQATKRSSSIISWRLKRLGFNNFPSRQQPSSGGNNNCKYVAMVSSALQCQLVFKMRKILIVDVDLGIK